MRASQDPSAAFTPTHFWLDYIVGLKNRVTFRADGLESSTGERVLLAREVALVRYQEQKLAQYLEQYRTEPPVWRQVAEIMQEEQKWPELEIFAERMRRQFPNLAMGFRLGSYAAMQRGNLDFAERMSYRGMLRFPRNSDCYFVFASCAARRNNVSEALHRRRLILARFPDNKWSTHGLLGSLLECNELVEADSLFQKANVVFPRDNDLLPLGAKIAEKRGHFAEAAKRWEAVLDVNSRNDTARQAVIRNWAASGRDDLARKAEADRAMIRSKDAQGVQDGNT